jgi:sterol 3beta-glucosyltransferase
MKVLILTSGSRGDVQPYVALAQGLADRDHTPLLAAPDAFLGFARDHGVPFEPVDSRILALKDDPKALQGNRLKLMQMVKPMLLQMLNDYWAAADSFKPDMVVYHPKTLVGYHIAERLRVPGVVAVPLPISAPTAAFPVPIMPSLPLGGWYNRLSYGAITLAGAAFGGMVNAWRKERLGLTRRVKDERVAPGGKPTPVMYAYSQHVVPRPADWGAHIHVTGYWNLRHSAHWQPSPALTQFLAAGDAPVYIGFGSMWMGDSDARTKMAIEAVERLGKRAILATGWGGLKADKLPATIFALENAPHEWLFPQMAAVVHHGGAGTTGAALQAGKPNVIVTFLGDQPFWGRQVAALGAGTPPINHKQLTADALTEKLRQALDPAMSTRAKAVGERICAEDGVTNAVSVLEALA